MSTILTYPNDALRKVAEAVTQRELSKGGTLSFLAMDMMMEMYAQRGIGLAAPQVGVNKRLIVIDTSTLKGEGGGFKGVMVNPIVVRKSEEKSFYEEGCLSFPGEHVNVERPVEIVVQYQTMSGLALVDTFRGITAKCIQHEIDHLEGVLFIDYGKSS